MRTFFRHVVAVTTVAAGCAVPSHATARLAADPIGRTCRFSSATDVTREAGWQVGTIEAGPLVTGESGTLVCEIHVNNNTHDGAAVFSTSYSTLGGAVVAAEPRVLNYPAYAEDSVSVCTEWRGPGGVLYWRPGNGTTGDLGGWSRSPASCAEPICVYHPDGVICVWI